MYLQRWPIEGEFETFEEYRLACEVWMKEHPDATLIRCKEGEPILFYDDMEARAPGHVYSYAGMRELSISGYCEYHFDQMTAAPDDENDSADSQSASESPDIAQSGDSVIEHNETPYTSLSEQDFNRLWDNETMFDNDDPNKPEPM